MNQKGFVNIVLVVVIVAVLVGAGTYFALNRQARLTTNPTPTPAPGTPAAGLITISGKTICLTKKGSGQQTLECSVGLQGTDGRSYVLKGYSDPEYKFAQVGLDVKVSGIFTPGEVKAADGNKYDVVGTIDVTSIKKVEGSTGPTSTGTVQPYDPNKDTGGLYNYPNYTLTAIPVTPISVKYLVEHRSALDQKTVIVRGVVIGITFTQPPCVVAGTCQLYTPPSIVLADTKDMNRDKGYDLTVLLSDDERGNEKEYSTGKAMEIKMLITASKTVVYGNKAY